MFLMLINMIGLLILYIISHAFIYFSIIKFFAIGNPYAKFAIASGLIFLAASFFIASVGAHFLTDPITRKYYYLSGIWVGFMVNLVFAFMIGWIVVFVTQKIGNPFGDMIIGSVMVVLAVIWSGWGMWNAMHPVVKEITVTIKNLPEYWKGKKIVQLSDVHLGFVYREKFIAKINDRVDELEPDVIAITGDLFDGSDGDLTWAKYSLDALWAPDGIYFVTGNHETYLGVDKSIGIVNNIGITLLHDSLVEKNGLQIIGVDYPMQGQKKDNAQIIKDMNFDPSKPSILLYHAPTQVEQMKDLGISLMLSGHTHVGQLFPFRLITEIVYKGFDYGLKQDSDFSIYTTNGLGTWGPAMRTANRPEIVSITLQ